jgi:hypothetical protein
MHRNLARFLSTAAAFGLGFGLAGASSSIAFADAHGGLFRPPLPQYHWHHPRPHPHHPLHRPQTSVPVPPVAPAAHDAPPADDAATCGGLAPGIESVPVDRIRGAITPTAQQNDILNQLQQASAKADGILQASCPKTLPLTPVNRLETIATRLEAMTQAIDLIRPQLTSLDQSLDAKQREAFDGLEYAKGQTSGPAQDLAALCKPQTASFTALPVTQIEAEIQPVRDQKAAFEALKTAAQTAAQKLAPSCPADTPKTLAERFDAVRKRLTDLHDAVYSMEPSLTHFYSALSDEQKARFNVITAGSQQATGKPGN